MKSFARHLFIATLALFLATTSPEIARAQDAPPPATQAQLQGADALFTAGDWEASESAYAALTKANPNGPMLWFRYAFALQMQGKYEPAIEAYRKSAKAPQLQGISEYNIACAEARLGDKEAAFSALARAVEGGFSDIDTMESDTDLASMREDPRMEELLKRANPVADQAKEFAFWVGEWDVFNAQGQQLGTNRIESRENGCLIVENWSNMAKNTGTSFNFIDPVDRRWRQVWVDPGGTVVRYEGEIKGGAMHFAGVNTSRSGAQFLTRMSFTPNEDGTVRQFIEHSRDDGATWQVYFDGIYRPRK